MTEARIGTSGWTYARWRGDFYPGGLRQRDELRYASEHFRSVEVNGSFYGTLRPSTWQRWATETAEDFCFAIKGPRYVTHLRRLHDTGPSVANFFASGLLALGPRLGPILWQLPPSLEFDEQRLASFLDLLPRTQEEARALAERHDDKLKRPWLPDQSAPAPMRHVLEPRHASFADPACAELCDAHGVALVEADTAGRFPNLALPAADLAYVRLHGEQRLYGGGYADESLDRWADKVRWWLGEGRDVYVYFDNDSDGCAPFDAERLAARVG